MGEVGLFGEAPGVGGAGAAAAAYRVLARKYRPTRFEELVGQESMVRILRNAFAQGRIAHAWMLTGVRGVGKTTTARIIARALNCVGVDGLGGPTTEPCGVCANCAAILADRHPDVIEMDAASNTGVDDVRQVIDGARYRPMQARSKVFIIDEVHMLSRNAFNALLKTLEEPPAHVKFIFATTEIRKVPVTVLSRCQRFDLRRISVSELAGLFGRVAAAEGVAVSAGALDLVARAADGSARDGLSLLDQAIAQGGAQGGVQGEGGEVGAGVVADMLGLADRAAVHGLMEAVLAGRADAVLAATDRAHERGADLGLLLQDMLELVHVLTRLKAVPGLREGDELPEAERALGASLADRVSMPVLGRLWQMLLKGVGEVEQAPDRRAAAEMVLIRACYVAELPTPGELVRRLGGGDGVAGVAGVAGGSGVGLGGGGAGFGGVGAGGGFEGAGSGGFVGGVGGQGVGGSGVGVQGVGQGGIRGALAVVRAGAVEVLPVGEVGAEVVDAEVAGGVVLRSFRDVAVLAEGRREALLHANLLHSVHLVRFAPRRIELRPKADAPRDLAGSLARLLGEATGERWTIALSQAEGEPTLAEQGRAADRVRREEAAEHPLVRAILQAFPGAVIAGVSDSRADVYGLVSAMPLGGVADGDGGADGAGEADMPEFAPLDAGFMDGMED